MKLYRALMFSLILTLVVVGVAYADGPVEERPTGDIQGDVAAGFIEVGGVSSQIQPGQRIETATLGATRTADGLCYLPHTRLSGQLVGEKNAGRIQVLIGADCSITVVAVEFATKKLIVPPPTATERFGWAKSELNDFVGIDLASVYVEMSYWDNGTSVYGGHDEDYECDYPFGWYQESCNSWWWPHGTPEVYIRAEGEFDHHTLDADHWQEAKFIGTPGKGRYECDYEGHVPGPVHWKCDGEKFG